MADKDHTRFVFTLARLRKLEPAAKEYAVFDEKQAGLQCRVYPTGRKVLFVHKRPKGSHRAARVQICTFDEISTLDDVRDDATDLFRELKKGINPNDAAKTAAIKSEAEGMTLQQALDAYIAPDRIAKNGKARTQEQIKKSTADGYKQHIEKHLDDWLGKQLKDINP